MLWFLKLTILCRALLIFRMFSWLGNMMIIFCVLGFCEAARFFVWSHQTKKGSYDRCNLVVGSHLSEIASGSHQAAPPRKYLQEATKGLLPENILIPQSHVLQGGTNPIKFAAMLLGNGVNQTIGWTYPALKCFHSQHYWLTFLKWHDSTVLMVELQPLLLLATNVVGGHLQLCDKVSLH